MRRYGSWAGAPEGRMENFAWCIAQVGDDSFGLFRQCLRKRGHGPGGLYCRQHARMLAEGKYVSVPEDRDENAKAE